MRCYILCGGLSRRMGTAKEALKIGGVTFFERIVNAAVPAFEEVVAVSRDHCHSAVRTIVERRHDDASPLYGIEAAVLDAGAKGDFKLWILAVDYPAITTVALSDFRHRFEADDRAEVLVPTADGEAHMLCAGYSTVLLPRIASRLQKKEFILRDLLSESRTVYFAAAETGVLRNINTPADYELLEQEHEQTHARR